MTKINREEYDILKGLEDTWKWIARDNKGCCKKLKAHASRPYKMVLHWSSGDIMLQLLEGESLFQFIQWGDEEPYSIAELIREYESEMLQHPVREYEDMEVVGEPCQEGYDPVHRPEHYMQGHIETIDKIKLLLTPEEYLGYLKGNVIKYDRAPFKGNAEQDYDKQKVYYDWALEQEANQ